MRALTHLSASPNFHSQLVLSPSVPVPAISPNQLLVKVLSVSINPVDYKVAEQIPSALRRLVYGSSGPITPGIDFCGRIVSIGSKAAANNKRGYKEGELVFGRTGATTNAHGTLAEYAPVNVDVAARVPEGVSPDEAACIGVVGETTYQAIQPYVKEGDKVFINGGAGGTGTFSVQIAKALGCHVTTTCSTRNVDLVKSLGADEVIDYTKTDVIEELKKKGQVFKLALDNVGTPEGLYKASSAFLVPEGRFNQIGAPASYGTILSIMKRALQPGILGGGKRPFTMMFPKHHPDEMELMARWIKEGKLKVVIEEPRYELEDGAKAFEKLSKGKNQGKIVVHVAKE